MQPVGSPSQRATQALEVGFAVATDEDHLAVEDDAVRRQASRQRADRTEPVGPVVAPAGENGDAPIALVGLGAVAVELDLVNPVVARRRMLNARRIERLYVAMQRIMC